MTEAASSVEHTVSDGFEQAKAAAGPAINHLAQREMNGAVAATQAVRNLVAHGVDDAQASANHLVDTAQVRANGSVDAIQRRVNAAIDASEHTAGGLIDRSQRLANRSLDAAQRVVNEGVDGAQGLINSAIDGLQGRASSVLDRLPGPLESLADLASRGLDAAQRASTGAVDGGQAAANGALDGGQRAGNVAVNDAQHLGTRAIDGAQQVLGASVDGSQRALGATTDATQQLGNRELDATQRVAAAQARFARQAAITGLDAAGSAVRPEALAGLSLAHSVLTQHNGDQQYDGALIGAGGAIYPKGTPLAGIDGVVPEGGARSNETIVYVNGISTTEQAEASDLQKIADATGAKVVGVHNSTDGFLADGAQVFTDKLAGRNAAVASLADTVYGELQAGHPVHLMAHSQGGLVSARALTVVKDRLMKQDGLTRAQAEQRLSQVTLETFAAAARNYPDGPKYIHTINRLDVVPGLLGLGPGLLGTGFDSHPGRGAVTRYFTGDLLAHGLIDQYLAHREAP